MLDLVLDAVMYFFIGAVPERPVSLRRLVQVFWGVITVLVVSACVFGVVYLVGAL